MTRRRLQDEIEQPGKKTLRLTFEVGDGDEVFESDDDEIVIGRANDAQVRVRHESVSRHHAKIVRSERGFEVVDLDSKNHVKLNTYRVQREWLRSGDRIDVGAARIYVDFVERQVSNPANVIFEEGGARPHQHTEVIDVDHMDMLLDSHNLRELPGWNSKAVWPADETRASKDPGKVAGKLLRLVNDAAETLLSCDSLDETLDRILALVFNSLPVERGIICFYDDATGRIIPKATRTLDGRPDDRIIISTQIARSSISEKRAILVQDAHSDRQFGGADSVILLDIRSAMCAPLYREGRVIGVIYVDRTSPRDHFETHHLQALSALAILSAVAVEHTSLRDNIRREREMRSKLARYCSPAVVDRIASTDDSTHRDMVSDEGEVSVLFADLTDFTSMAENLRPREVIRVLNQVFERLCAAVFDYEGTLDKFRGDGMMAFFGAPLAQPDHAERAVRAALRMQALLADVNANAHKGRFISMRVGINSGPVVVGDIGSPQRKDYTVIGDVVNIASRLESSVAQPGQVVIGPRTYRQIQPLFNCQELDAARLKGRIRTVKPYLVLGRKNDKARE
ncbi:MAG: adenylate/guanylate cyclase domain-containing protein [Myxococcota bacterium]|jgi:adenylate cyclase|nr:adenylate/guanylate cyclase domain-containing protein [Myxococcota bacterium]